MAPKRQAPLASFFSGSLAAKAANGPPAKAAEPVPSPVEPGVPGGSPSEPGPEPVTPAPAEPAGSAGGAEGKVGGSGEAEGKPDEWAVALQKPLKRLRRAREVEAKAGGAGEGAAPPEPPRAALSVDGTVVRSPQRGRAGASNDSGSGVAADSPAAPGPGSPSGAPSAAEGLAEPEGPATAEGSTSPRKRAPSARRAARKTSAALAAAAGEGDPEAAGPGGAAASASPESPRARSPRAGSPRSGSPRARSPRARSPRAGSGAAGAPGAAASLEGVGAEAVRVARELASFDELGAVTWTVGTPVPFSVLSDTFESIAEESRRLEISRMLANCFRSILAGTPEDLLPTLYLCTKRIAPAAGGDELGVGDAILIKAVASATGKSEAAVKAAYGQCGDLGTVAVDAKGGQRALFPLPRLTVRGVLDDFRKIARCQGQGATKQRQALIVKLFGAAKGAEVGYLVRGLQGKLRIGLAEQSVMVALAHAVAMHEVDRAARHEGAAGLDGARAPPERAATPTATDAPAAVDAPVDASVAADASSAAAAAVAAIAADADAAASAAAAAAVVAASLPTSPVGSSEADPGQEPASDAPARKNAFALMMGEGGRDATVQGEAILSSLAAGTATSPPGSARSDPMAVAVRLGLAAKAVKLAYSRCPSLDVLVPALLAHPVLELGDHVRFTPGVPVKPMLAKPATRVADVIGKFSAQPFTCEYKYDGERAQVHVLWEGPGGPADAGGPTGSSGPAESSGPVDASDPAEGGTAATRGGSEEDGPKGRYVVRIYSRNGEDTTERYPDVVRDLPLLLTPGTRSVVLDAEAVAYDRAERKIRPFQDLARRGRKGVKADEVTIAVCLFAFDCLERNGRVLLDLPLRARREELEAAVRPRSGELELARHTTSNDVEELSAFLDVAVAAGTEGLIVKTLDDPYEPSRRSSHWLKLKKDYLEGVGDTFDLVPIGAWYGKGKRRGVYGSYLLAVYDEDRDEYQTICKVATGFSEELLVTLAERASENLLEEPLPSYRYADSPLLRPDVWLAPSAVWEVKAADISISPAHKAAAGLVDPSKGISIRFPRLLRVRDDKRPEDSTSPSQVASMYRAQAVHHVKGDAAGGDDDDY